MNENNERKYYSYETNNIQKRDKLRKFLQESNIYYEVSECYDSYHFEIKLN